MDKKILLVDGALIVGTVGFVGYKFYRNRKDEKERRKEFNARVKVNKDVFSYTSNVAFRVNNPRDTIKKYSLNAELLSDKQKAYMYAKLSKMYTNILSQEFESNYELNDDGTNSCNRLIVLTHEFDTFINDLVCVYSEHAYPEYVDMLMKKEAEDKQSNELRKQRKHEIDLENTKFKNALKLKELDCEQEKELKKLDNEKIKNLTKTALTGATILTENLTKKKDSEE